MKIAKEIAENSGLGLQENIDKLESDIKEYVKQALELAAERAEILDKETGISWTGILIADEASYEVDKKSILNVMDEIE